MKQDHNSVASLPRHEIGDCEPSAEAIERAAIAMAMYDKFGHGADNQKQIDMRLSLWHGTANPDLIEYMGWPEKTRTVENEDCGCERAVTGKDYWRELARIALSGSQASSPRDGEGEASAEATELKDQSNA